VTPVPEPAGDVRAQLAAALAPYGPKRAAFLVPRDAQGLDPAEFRNAGVYVAEREEGMLVTLEQSLAEAFNDAPEGDDFDRVMAEILGYPEDKHTVVSRCRGKPATVARAVQARDAEGHVVQEAFCSPLGLLETCAAVQQHVPPGGSLEILPPILAMSRRVAMRLVEQ
jgi:hypothetical protein